WAGDPLAFKLSGWDVPCASLPSTPPTAAVFMTDGSEAVVTVHTPMNLVNTPGGGPPAHTNDYDELWLLHATDDIVNDRLGKLRWEPQGLTQPGFQRRNGGAPRRPADVPTMNVNIDVRHRLHLTTEALAYVRD